MVDIWNSNLVVNWRLRLNPSYRTRAPTVAPEVFDKIQQQIEERLTKAGYQKTSEEPLTYARDAETSFRASPIMFDLHYGDGFGGRERQRIIIRLPGENKEVVDIVESAFQEQGVNLGKVPNFKGNKPVPRQGLLYDVYTDPSIDPNKSTQTLTQMILGAASKYGPFSSQRETAYQEQK